MIGENIVCAGLMCPSDKEREERENGGPGGSGKPGISVRILYCQNHLT